MLGVTGVSVAEGSLVAVATGAAGFVNAVAGGGSLVSYPALLATGLSPLSANVTNTLAIWPGYLGGAGALAADLDREDRRLPRLAIAAALGAVGGSALLLGTDPDVFEVVVPYLVLLSAVLLALPSPWMARLRRRAERPAMSVVTVALAGAYGAYFGGGLGVILLAVLSLFVGGDLRGVNPVKAALALLVNTIALVSFVGFAPVSWGVAAVGAPAALLGGVAGGRCSARIDGRLLRRLVVAFSVAVGVALLVR
ncbi:MAG: sulfite exporter TauE/SafE family protein [Acidimicrobiia bacterium]